jgi:signal transduction histidine kinase
MKLRSASLTTQLSIMLVAGIAAAHLIGVLLSQRGVDELHPLDKKQAFERVVLADRLLAACRMCNREKLLDSQSNTRIRFFLERENPLAHQKATTRETNLERQLQRVGEWPEHAVSISLNRNFYPEFPLPARNTSELVTALRHGDQWLVSVQHLAPQKRWWRLLLFSFADSVLPVLLVVMLFARWLLHPLRDLEMAARKMSQGIYAMPLPKRGPREMQELVGAFNAMQDALSRLLRDRTSLLASISHDLRTPITSLRLRTELVEDGANKTAMLQTITQLQRMVDEALSFLRGESCQEKREHYDLGALLTELVAQRSETGRNIDYSGPSTLAVSGFPLAMSRAVNNLLDNALRHGSRVILSIQESPEQIELQISDDGPGIPEEFQERVFEPFFRLTADEESESKHMGLGLSIVRSCVQRHGGTVSLRNGEEKGLQATIVLPRRIDTYALREHSASLSQ